MHEKASDEALELRIKELEAIIKLHNLDSKAPIYFHPFNMDGLFMQDNQNESRVMDSEMKEDYWQLFQNMPAGFAIHEIITDKKGVPIDYRYLDVNPAFERLTGLKRNDIVGRCVSAFNSSAESNQIKLYGSVALTGKPLEFENYISAQNKYFQVYTYQTKPGFFATIFSDITDRKLMEISLMRSEEKYRQLFEFLPIGLNIADMDGTIIAGNKEAEKLLQIPVQAQSSRSIYDQKWRIIRKDGTEMPSSEFASVMALSQMRRIENVEMGLKAPNDEVTWINVTSAPLVNNDGLIIAYANITEKIEREKQLKEYSDKLQEANAMKDRFISIIAHDLRNPFNSIIGFTDLLMNNMGEYDVMKIRKFVSIIDQAAKQTLDLLDNLLVWTRSQTGAITFSPVDVNLNEVIQKNVNLVIIQATKKGIVLHVNPVNDIIIQADKNMIDTIIRNLLTNAIKFTLPNGIVEISAVENEHTIELSIKDSGVGIEPENLEHLFQIDNNYTRKGTANEHGSGLGLILCKDFIEKHGGSIRVESELGVGSTFTVVFPKGNRAVVDGSSVVN